MTTEASPTTKRRRKESFARKSWRLAWEAREKAKTAEEAKQAAQGASTNEVRQ